MLGATTWMDLEIIMLSEKNHPERQISYDTSWKTKYKKWTYLKLKQSQRCRKLDCGEEKGIKYDIGVSLETLV